jgi:hypothetical protein
MKFKRCVEGLEQIVLTSPPDAAPARQRWQKVLDRFFRLFDQAAELLSPDEEPRVERALRALRRGRCWAARTLAGCGIWRTGGPGYPPWRPQ